MAQRTQLQSNLESLLGSENVYFQPPPNTRMNYPAIVYHLDDMDTKSANNVPYLVTRRYLVTVIDANPDSPFVGAVANLPMCLFNRGFSVDNLNHNVFTLYF